MRRPLALTVPSLLLLTLTACPDDPVEPSSGSETDTETGTGTSTTEPVTPTSTEPEPDTTSTGPDLPTDPVTTEPIDPSTTTTTDPTIDPSTTTTTETTDTTGTTADTSTGTTEDTTGTTTDTTDTGDLLELTSVWVTSNPAGLAPDRIIGVNPGLDAQLGSVAPIGDVLSIQSIAIDGGGDGIITVDLVVPMTGGVIIDEDMVNNPPATGTIGLGQRFIHGPLTELKTPKGVEADVPGGVFLVADTAAKDIKAYDNDDDGDVAPLYKITNIGASAGIWDMHYEDNDDALYAAGTDGVVRVYDNFSVTKGAAGPTRSITPFVSGAKASLNLHGISVLNNVLYLSDVGLADNATDGKVFVITDAGGANGDVEVFQQMTGGKLGNPVDLEVVQQGAAGDLILVAEKSNDAMISFRRTGNNQFGAATNFNNLAKLESVAIITNNQVILASNTVANETDQAFIITPNDMNPPMPSSTLSQLGSATSIQSVLLTGDGNGLVSFDGPAPGGAGVFAVPGLRDIVTPDTPAPIALARLWGPSTGIKAPKGIVLGGTSLFVADFGAADVKVFDAADIAAGDSAPLFKLTGDAAPWDVAYDAAADRLFVAEVDGTVRVYDEVLASEGAGATREFTPCDDQNTQISVNLHGIEYVAATDTLLLSDVGSAMVATDGQLFIVGDASIADGDVPVIAQVGGDMTKLGNPVDIAWDGTNLYVAEKANNKLLRYDNFTALTGTNNLAESATRDVPAAESVALGFTPAP